MHQLDPDASLPPGVGRDLRTARPGRRRRAHAGVRHRARQSSASVEPRARCGVDYPIAIDNDYAVWDAFANQYWPALYIADAEGRIRHHHFGEGGYERSERVIRHLLADAGAAGLPDGPAPVDAGGIEAPADWDHLRSPETYLGLARSSGFASPGGGALDDRPRLHGAAAPAHRRVGARRHVDPADERRCSNEPYGHIAYRFHARDLNLILAPPATVHRCVSGSGSTGNRR